MATRPPKEKTRIDLPELQKLIRMIERSPITEFELVEQDLKIRISKHNLNGNASPAYPLPSYAIAPQAIPGAPQAVPAIPAAPAPTTAGNIVEVKAPMVGTYYRAPSPDAEAYVRVGDLIEPGKVLCIIEAMKLMNEIEAELRGRVVEMLVENAQPVEFGQVLFRIEKTS